MIHYVNHHLCHASSFYLSQFEEASILTVDAFGEKQCCTFAEAKNSSIEQIKTFTKDIWSVEALIGNHSKQT